MPEEEAPMSVETIPPSQDNAQKPPERNISRRGLFRGALGLRAASVLVKGGEPALPIHDARDRLNESFSTSGHRISFEPGNHNYLKKMGRSEYQETLDGRLDSHAWNPEVLERLQQRDPQVKILTIDSMSTRTAAKKTLNEKSRPESDLDYLDAALLWSWLPGNPSQINADGSVYVINTEQMVVGNSKDHARSIQKDVRGNSPFFQDGEQPELRRAIEEMFAQSYDKNLEQKDVEAIYDISKLLGAALGVEVGYTAFKSLHASHASAEDKAKLLPTRRKVLGWGLQAGVAGAAALSAKGLSGARYYHWGRAINAKNNEDKNHHVDMVNLLSPDSMVVSDWVDARNAMYVLKTKDCMDAMGAAQLISSEEEGVLLAGGAHTNGMPKLMESEEACGVALQKYTIGIFEVVDRIAQGDPSINAMQVKENIVRMMSAANIYKVQDASAKLPVSMRFERAVQYKGGGLSPRVFNALTPLLPSIESSDVGIIMRQPKSQPEMNLNTTPVSQTSNQSLNTQPIAINDRTSSDDK